MNWLGKVGLTLFLLSWLCIFLYIYMFFIGALVGFVLMFVSVLYDRYKQLETEEVRPKV